MIDEREKKGYLLLVQGWYLHTLHVLLVVILLYTCALHFLL